jgi:lysophospholipase L1-like esterase
MVAQLIPVASHEGNRRINRLNRALAELPHVRDLRARVIVVDQFSGFDPVADTYDGIHPNERGEEKMAEVWFGALNKVL